MTLQDIKAADEQTQTEFANTLYSKLVQLYQDQYGNKPQEAAATN